MGEKNRGIPEKIPEAVNEEAFLDGISLCAISIVLVQLSFERLSLLILMIPSSKNASLSDYVLATESKFSRK